MDRQKAVFIALSDFFGEKPKISWFSETDKKTHFFCGKALFFEMFLWNMERSFGNPAEIFST